MGLSHRSVGLSAISQGISVEKKHENHLIVALAGNPNVGKSTVFNELTGLNQHTGNWPGKTVSNAKGNFFYRDYEITLVDVPGCYSMLAHSPEEEVARDFICFGKTDKTIIVCDATCLERSIALVLQTAEMTKGCIVCVNLIDEAEKRGITVSEENLIKSLSLPVVFASARSGIGLTELKKEIANQSESSYFSIQYPEFIEECVRIMEPSVKPYAKKYGINPKWLAIRLLEGDDSFEESISQYIGEEIFTDRTVLSALNDAKDFLAVNGIPFFRISESIATSVMKKAEEICRNAVTFQKSHPDSVDRKIDKIVTGKWTAFPFMALLLAILFWITLNGANIPSEYLARILFSLEEKMFRVCLQAGMPNILCEMLFHGVYRVLAWVVSVMLPPMAIFFPLFTLMEDVGLLPRIAFNLDRAFSKCNACGKQSLTMCMGFGCNAAGIVGCRIIDSPRERLIAMLTNVFVPCNGRFPILISIITMFFLSGISGFQNGIFSAFFLAFLIVLGFFATLLASRLLSQTLLKGIPSSFTLELPPYRPPQIIKVLIRSILDRTVFVLGRSVAVAAPAGLLIWILANIKYNGVSYLNYCTQFLDPLGRFFGLDGVILVSFLLGFPANEIVIPIMLMAYTSSGTLTDIGSLTTLKALLLENGWTVLTAFNVLIFTLMHFPCSTTLLTIQKESGKLRWTLLAFFLPTLFGLSFCLLNRIIFAIFNIV